MIGDLFDQIGGRSAVEAATELFYHKVLHDDSLRHFFEQVDKLTWHTSIANRLCLLACSSADECIQGKVFMTPMPAPEITV
jgi:hypothetical protein